MESKRILHFIDSGGLYGAESVILNLSREMLHEGEFTAVIGCIVQDSQERVELFEKARSLGIEATLLKICNARLLTDLPIVARKLKRMDIHMIHSHGYKPSVFGFIIHLLIGIPIMATCHLWFSGKGSPLKYRMMTWLESRFYKYFPKVISVSPRIQEILERKGIRNDKLKVIPNGIFVDDYGKAGTEKLLTLREKLGISENDRVVVNVGRLTEQKAQENLIEAAMLLKKEGCEVRILVVGEGHLREKLEASIRDHDVEDSFHLLGFREDIPDVLQASDIFVLPSIDEGMPMALLEAMAVGLPVISTRVGILPEIFRDRKEIYFLPDNNPATIAAGIRCLLNDPVFAGEIGSAGKEKTAASFSSRQMYEEYAPVYSELFHSK